MKIQTRAEAAKVSSKSEIPLHVGIILDGNRRWAKARNLPTLLGHKRGGDNVRAIVEAAHQRGVQFISLFVFSTENWQREKAEVTYLFNIFRVLFKKELAHAKKNNIRLRFLGRKYPLPADIIKLCQKGMDETVANTGITVNFALNYGGRQEIVDAAKQLIDAKVKSADLDEELFASKLYASDIPDIDLLIRTSGEQRISNFLLWQSAYAELYFTPVTWPDFTIKELDKALLEYKKRQRRYGK